MQLGQKIQLFIPNTRCGMKYYNNTQDRAWNLLARFLCGVFFSYHRN